MSEVSKEHIRDVYGCASLTQITKSEWLSATFNKIVHY